MKIVYTCIIDGYDDLKEPINLPPHAHQQWKFICFSDNPNLKTINAFEEEIPRDKSIWEIHPIKEWQETPAKTARWHKINFHKCIGQECLWVDGTFFINQDLNRWWRRYNGNQFTVIRHPFDNCAYKDIQSCIGGGKGDMFKLMQQAINYKKEGLPENSGLIASGILHRKMTDDVVKFCETWWDQVDQYTERDQPSFTYTAWKYPTDITIINWDYTQRDEFIHVPHVHKTLQRQNRFKSIKKMI